MTSAIGGGPLLVANGKAVFRARESFGDPLLSPRSARSAVGQLSDGRILLVTAEGGSSSYSAGMTNYELAVALARLGAKTAMALGSGQSAAMAFDGSLLTRPTGPAEQPISDALVLSYNGVYAAPPSTAVALAERRRCRRHADVLLQARAPLAGDSDLDRAGSLDADARSGRGAARSPHTRVGREGCGRRATGASP